MSIVNFDITLCTGLLEALEGQGIRIASDMSSLTGRRNELFGPNERPVGRYWYITALSYHIITHIIYHWSKGFNRTSFVEAGNEKGFPGKKGMKHIRHHERTSMLEHHFASSVRLIRFRISCPPVWCRSPCPSWRSTRGGHPLGADERCDGHRARWPSGVLVEQPS